MKQPDRFDQAWRCGAATLAYRYSPDLRAAQDILGHANTTATAAYACVVAKE